MRTVDSFMVFNSFTVLLYTVRWTFAACVVPHFHSRPQSLPPCTPACFVLMPWDSWQRRNLACFPDQVFSSQSLLCSATIPMFAFGPGGETSGVTFLLFPLAHPHHKYQIFPLFSPPFEPPSQIACSFCCVLKFPFEMEMLERTELFLGFNRKKKKGGQLLSSKANNSCCCTQVDLNC